MIVFSSWGQTLKALVVQSIKYCNFMTSLRINKKEKKLGEEKKNNNNNNNKGKNVSIKVIKED